MAATKPRKVKEIMRQRRPQIFLSYAKQDQKQARELAEALQALGVNVWFDEAELLTGGEWAQSIQNALDKSTGLALLISPAAMDSKQVANEIRYALTARHMEGRLFPILLRRTPNVPWILESLRMLPFESAEKTAALIAGSLKAPAV